MSTPGRRSRLGLLAVWAATAILVTGCGSNGTSSGGETSAAIGSRNSSTDSSTTTDSSAKDSGAPSSSGTNGLTKKKKGGGVSTPPYPTPGTEDSPDSQREVLKSLPGKADGSCVATPGRDYHSGGVAMGNFTAARKAFTDQWGEREQPEVSMYVISAEPTDKTKVKVTLSGPGGKRTYTSASPEQADLWTYYNVTMYVPDPGAYTVNVSASRSGGGTDRGCFKVTFTG